MTGQAQHPAGAKSALGRFYAWLGVKAVSDLSSAMIGVILATYVYKVTGSATMLGAVLAIQLAGAVLSGLLIPYLKAFSRRDVILMAQFGAGAAVGLLGVVPQAWDVVVIYITPLLLGLFQGLVRVAMVAEIPALIGPEMRYRFNAILSASDGLAFVGGSLLATVILNYLSFKQVFIFDSLTFFLSALSFFFLRYGFPVQSSGERSGSGMSISGSLISGLGLVMCLTIAGRFIEAFGSGTHNIGFPLKSHLYDAANPSLLYGCMLASWGAGRMVATVLAPRIARRLQANDAAQHEYFVLMLIVTFFAFLFAFNVNGLFFIVALLIVAGLFDALTEASYYSILQSVPDGFRNKVVGFSYAVERSALAMGMICVGFAFEAHPVDGVATWFYGVSIFFGFVILIFLRKAAPGNNMNSRSK